MVLKPGPTQFPVAKFDCKYGVSSASFKQLLEDGNIQMSQNLGGSERTPKDSQTRRINLPGHPMVVAVAHHQ